VWATVSALINVPCVSGSTVVCIMYVLFLVTK